MVVSECPEILGTAALPDDLAHAPIAGSVGVATKPDRGCRCTVRGDDEGRCVRVGRAGILPHLDAVAGNHAVHHVSGRSPSVSKGSTVVVSGCLAEGRVLGIPRHSSPTVVDAKRSHARLEHGGECGSVLGKTNLSDELIEQPHGEKEILTGKP